MNDNDSLISAEYVDYNLENVINVGSEKTTSEKLINKHKFRLPYFQLLYVSYQLVSLLGIKPENIRLRQHLETEKAFYADDAWDIELKLKDVGWYEIIGIHDRGNYDISKVLRNHKSDMEPPRVLELAIGTDRLFYAILDNLFEDKDVSEGKSILRIPYYLSWTQVNVLPLVKNNPKILDFAKDVYNKLRPYFNVEFNVSGAIGKRYLRSGIKGIPYCITIDYDSLENNDVTIRDRDTEKQDRVKVDELVSTLLVKLKN